jgi:hypothetical protein
MPPPPNSNPKNPSFSLGAAGTDCLPKKYPTVIAAKVNATI